MNTNKPSYNIFDYLRPVFAGILPVFYAVLLSFLVAAFYNHYEQRKAEDKINLWREKAQVVLASIQSNFDLTQIIRSAGNDFAFKVEKDYPGKLDLENFSNSFRRQMLEQVPVKPEFVWAFAIKDNRAKAIVHPDFENSRRKIMEMVFSGLLQFSSEEKITQAYITSQEKFIKKVLGQYSSPLILGRMRQGEPTPVIFAEQNYFFYWRKFSVDDKPFAGIMMLFPAELFNEKEAGLQQVCERIFTESGRKLAAAFVPTEKFIEDKAIILPSSFNSNKISGEKEKLLSILQKLQPHPTNLKGQIDIIDDFIFLRSFYSLNHIYDAVIFAPASSQFFPAKFPFYYLLLLLLFLWSALIAYFFRRYGRFYLPLTVSFRLYFFLSGIFPVVLLFIVGQGLIQKHLDAEISSLAQQGTEQLAGIDQRSDKLPAMFGMAIREIISRQEMQKTIQNLEIDNLNQIFNAIQNEMWEKELDLNFLFAYAPGRKGVLYLSDQREFQDAKLIFDLMACSVHETSRDYQSIFAQGETELDSGQKTWIQSLKGIGNNFLQSVFSHTIEKENTVSIGKDGNNFLFSSIVLKDNVINKFLTFSVNSEKMFRNFLRRELDSINVNGNTIVLAAEERLNSDFTLFPFKKMNVLNSRQGKTAFNFMKKCRGSLFPRVVSSKDFLYIFHPISKIKKYATGSIISLNSARLTYDLKMLFLWVFVIILLILMYMLASFATGYFLVPVHEINQAFMLISKGELNRQFKSERKDELGLLINTINLMVKGFQKRIRLGKFVSGTLERSLKNMHEADKFKKPEIITGTILFSDIRDFTSISEKESPEIVAEMLNFHLDAMVSEIQLYGGQVEQFIGDAIVAVFSETDQYAQQSIDKALNAAVAMRLRHEIIRKQRREKKLFTYEIGIGIEFGTLTTGMISSGTRSEFIVLGEAKAIAEKLESASKLGRFSRIITSARIKENHRGNLVFVKLPDCDNYEIKL